MLVHKVFKFLYSKNGKTSEKLGKVSATYMRDKRIILIYKELLKINKEKNSNQKNKKGKEGELSSRKPHQITKRYFHLLNDI